MPATTLAGNIQQPASTSSTVPTTTVSQEPAEPVPEPEPEYRLETVTKNYVIHELAQQTGAPKPTWAENMQAMFGDHVKWDEVKAYVGKNRPLCKLSVF